MPTDEYSGTDDEIIGTVDLGPHGVLEIHDDGYGDTDIEGRLTRDGVEVFDVRQPLREIRKECGLDALQDVLDNLAYDAGLPDDDSGDESDSGGAQPAPPSPNYHTGGDSYSTNERDNEISRAGQRSDTFVCSDCGNETASNLNVNQGYGPDVCEGCHNNGGGN